MMSGLGPPPSQWQLDTPVSGRALAKNDALALAGDVEEVSNAWKNVKSITDGGKGVDLYDLLSYSSRDTQYSLQHQGVSLTSALWLQDYMSYALTRHCDPHTYFDCI